MRKIYRVIAERPTAWPSYAKVLDDEKYGPFKTLIQFRIEIPADKWEDFEDFLEDKDIVINYNDLDIPYK